MAPIYWAEALAMAIYLLNRRACSAISQATPFQLYRKAHDYNHLCVFGCLCYQNLSAIAPHKLAPRSIACVLLGYHSSHKGYHCLDLATRLIIISRHIVFDESCFPFGQQPCSSSGLDFLLARCAASEPCTAAAAPFLADVPLLADVEQTCLSPPAPVEEDPAIILHEPGLSSSSTSSHQGNSSIPAPTRKGTTRWAFVTSTSPRQQRLLPLPRLP